MVELKGMGEAPCTKLALSVEPWTISKRHKFLIVFQLQKLQYMFYYRILFRFEIRKLVVLNWSDFYVLLMTMQKILLTYLLVSCQIYRS